MKEQKEKSAEELDKELALRIEEIRKKADCDIFYQKQFFKFRKADIKTKTKILQEEKDFDRKQRWFGSRFQHEKELIAREVLKKALQVSVNIQQGSYLNIGNLRMMPEHFNIKLKVWDKIFLRFKPDFSSWPSDDTIMQYVKQVAPNCRTVVVENAKDKKSNIINSN